ncbi:MAG: formylglycine-generating enzyme family protein, partial [Anaeromyxobacteraceae bacterium]|nr:formylglycine-generating enzyme family protein [Anaeromyxobacteraceae bacterium]
MPLSSRPRHLRPGIALAAALVLGAPAAALGQDACPAGMGLLGGGRFTLADGSEAAEVPALCLDLTEVTAADYAACVARGACPDAALRCGKAATYGDKAKAGHPVNCVSWIEADRYCRAHGKRLPTEGEWEWAARGQGRGTRYPWGSAPPADRACWDGVGSTLGKGGRNETCAVGAFAKGDSPDGFHDLGGNVREWTASRIGRDRVVRGGSWGDSLPDFLAAGFRGMNKPDERFELTGFRCAAAPAPA